MKHIQQILIDSCDRQYADNVVNLSVPIYLKIVINEIYRQIVTQGMIEIIKMAEVVMNTDSKLIGYNTDSLYVENPNIFEIEEINNKKYLKEYPKYKLEKWSPKKYKVDEEKVIVDLTDDNIDWNILAEDIETLRINHLFVLE